MQPIALSSACLLTPNHLSNASAEIGKFVHIMVFNVFMDFMRNILHECHFFILSLKLIYCIKQILPCKRIPHISRIYTLLVVCLGFVVFRADSIGAGFTMIGKMFSGAGAGAGAASFALQQLTPWFTVMLLAAVIGCAPVKGLAEKIRAQARVWLPVKRRESAEVQPEGQGTLTRGQAALQVVLYIGAFLLLAWCMLRLSGNAYNPFIYFKF